MKTKPKIRIVLSVVLLLSSTFLSNSATFTVTNTNDSGPGSLRQAIIDANTTAGQDFIHFSIFPGGVLHTIQPLTPLPALADPTGVIINGYTQPGSQANSSPMGSPSNAILLIEIKGTFIPGQVGITSITMHNWIIGLIINGFTSGTGILVDGSVNSISTQEVFGCYIGTNSTGTAANGNMTGIQILNVNGSPGLFTIGNGTDGGRCLISGNQTGIMISASSGVSINGCYIGPHVHGLTHIGNTTGIVVQNGASNNYIGSQIQAGATGTNIISGNGHGIVITGLGTNANFVLGNFIGLNALGAALGNSGSGVRIENGASNNEVGYYSVFHLQYRNIISGNGFPVGYSGVDIKDTGTAGNIVQGNYIGTDPAGQTAIPNGGNGISIFFGAASNQIGGMHANVISGNSLNGIWFTDAGSNYNLVLGNIIGLDATGLFAIPNSLNGILIDNAASLTQVGMGGPYTNYISGNLANGVEINGMGTNSTVLHCNRIGLTTGNTPAGNGMNGVKISNNQGNTLIGGINPFESNGIAWNNGHGILIDNSSHNLVLSYSASTTGPNAIFSNLLNGICVTGEHADHNTFTQNKIYDNGGLGIDLGNNGVTLNDPLDIDSGPNQELNFPVITSAVYISGTTTGTGILDIDTNPGQANIEIYLNTNCDPSGYGEGEFYVTTVSPDGLGNWSFITTGLLPGEILSAIAIDVNANTSEFGQCFVVIDETPPLVDFGDAPEGALAYPSSGVIGQFPTCIGVGAPGSYIQHNNKCLAFGITAFPVDGEPDGNAGLCPVFNPNQYNQDECFQDGDAGLLLPGAFTITGNIGSEMVVPCPNPLPVPLGNVCTSVIWGGFLDVFVKNCMSSGLHAYFNLLIDWNQDGQWAGASVCPSGLNTPEHCIVNFFIPNGFNGPLSILMPPSFSIGPNSGYVWCRFTLTDVPVSLPWDGSGIFEDGETEDYLLFVGEFHDFGDAPEGALAYPATGVIGQFPTCKNVGPPGSWIEHAAGSAMFGFSWDGEADGNAGLCPSFNPNMYNMDECFQDGDAGLLIPGAFTIAGSPGAEVVIPCPGSAPLPIGHVCTPAIWGQNIDIHVQNFSPNIVFVNVLFDWNHDGIWSGSATCPGGLLVPEYVLVNHPVPPGFIGPLSATGPSPFTIGPVSSFVWARFTISSTVFAPGWDGSGVCEDGETEDYLLYVLPTQDINLQNMVIPGGTSQCIEAAQTITMAGAGTTFIVQNGAIVHLVAGNNIIMKEGTHFQSGSYVHAYIDLSGEFCTNPKTIVIEEEPLPEILPFELDDKESFFKVYPNPNTGQFTLELSDATEFSTIKVEIFSLIGESIMNVDLPEMKQYLFDLSARQPGIYLIRVMQGNDVGVVKVVKQ